MTAFLNTVRSNIVVQAVLFLVIGVVLLLMPDITLVMAVYAVGAIFALSGVASLINYFRTDNAIERSPSVLTAGIFFLIIAAIMFVFPEVIAGVFSVALGVILVLCGIVNAVRSLDMRGLQGNAWIPFLVLSIITVIGGVVVIWNPFDTTVLFVMVLGTLFIINGVSDLLIELSMRRLPSPSEG